MGLSKENYEQWEQWGYETVSGRAQWRSARYDASAGAYKHREDAVRAWLAGAERAGREAYEAGKDLETEAAKIEDLETRVAFRKGYPDGVLVPAQEQFKGPSQTQLEKPVGIKATLAERGARYGQFKDQAVYADKINDVLVSSPNWAKMAPDQREALRIIANKIGRILNGDPDYADSWHDIAGYAKLVDDRLNGVTK